MNSKIKRATVLLSLQEIEILQQLTSVNNPTISLKPIFLVSHIQNLFFMRIASKWPGWLEFINPTKINKGVQYREHCIYYHSGIHKWSGQSP